MNFKRNYHKERCLVCCREQTIDSQHIAQLISFGYEVQIVRSRVEAMRAFIAKKHSLVLVESSFLPRHVHRLVLLFKLAHRTPALLFLAPGFSDVFTYLYSEKSTPCEFVSTPVSYEDLALSVKRVSERLKVTGRNLFYHDLLIFCALGLPVAVVLMILFLH